LRVNLVANIHRPDALEAAANLSQTLVSDGHEVGFEPETARHLDVSAIRPEAFGVADLAVAFGGDGTLIRAAHLCADHGTPILGVYYGRFGFVTQCTSGDILGSVASFFRGEIAVESRLMLDAELYRAGQLVTRLHALNEIVVQRAATARMMTFQVQIDGRLLTTYPADGVLVSSPTGSTAYNLSAGGPILDPTVEALVLTAISPHTLSARPLVLKPTTRILLQVLSDGDAVLSADGQTKLHILRNDEIRVTRSDRVTNLVVVQDDDFLVKLGQRLFWSKGLVVDDE
jgi:NAD+ kinase